MIKIKASRNAIAICIFFFLPFTARLQPNAAGNNKAWVKQSDHYTQMLIDLDEKYSPEYGSSQGLAAYDSLISVPSLANQQAKRKEEEDLVTEYTAALQNEKEAPVLQDLQILIHHLKLDLHRQDYAQAHRVPFLNAASTIYEGLESLLDDQTAPDRRQAAVTRIKKYAGLEAGYRPTTLILQERVEQQISAGNMIFPSRQEMEVELPRNASIISGIADLCKKYGLTGWEAPYEQLKKQVADYDQWTRDQVLSKARADYRLPPEEYALQFENYGIDIPPAEIAKMAHAAFSEIQ
ncbi:MAG: DUF885 family protein, partial [Bacteroidota bacterium]|nr:DUF885 family protein [Bacteroidota bacterium]